MRRRRTLALLGSALLPAAGCTDPAGTGGSDTPTPAPEPTGTPEPTATPSPTPTPTPAAETPPPDAVRVATPGPGDCEATAPPSPEGNGLESPARYPERPSDPTPEAVRAYLVAYEEAYAHNATLADGNPPEGMVVSDVRFEGSVAAFRSGDGWALAGVAVDGAVGYGHAPTPTPETPAPTPTPVPGITRHRRASYLLTDRFLLRQDRGHDGDPPAAVDGGVVLECF
jgi:hypothetical protein